MKTPTPENNSEVEKLPVVDGPSLEISKGGDEKYLLKQETPVPGPEVIDNIVKALNKMEKPGVARQPDSNSEREIVALPENNFLEHSFSGTKATVIEAINQKESNEKTKINSALIKFGVIPAVGGVASGVGLMVLEGLRITSMGYDVLIPGVGLPALGIITFLVSSGVWVFRRISNKNNANEARESLG